MHTSATKISEEARRLGVERYDLEPETDGRTVTMCDEPWQDCGDPQRLRELIGFDDEFPYEAQSQPVPTLAAAA